MTRALRSWWLDVAVAAAVFGFGALFALLSSEASGPAGLDVVAAAALSVCVALRRRLPLLTSAGFVVTIVAMAARLSSPQEQPIALFGLMVFPYALGAHAKLRPGLALLACIAAGVVAVEPLDDEPGTDVFFPNMLAFAAYLAGHGVRSRTRLAAELHEAAAQAQEERESEAAGAAAAERRRIAREMHDVVAHSISVMVVQAGGARRILDRDPARAAQAATEIERAGRDALGEMRRLLGIFHTAAERHKLAPQPGLDGLEALVEGARGAGLPVELRVEGDRRPLPPGIDLAAYRIVQEALTNAIKHADLAPTNVVLRWAADALELAIEDAGPGPRGNGYGGHGLIGMRERVNLYGGELRTGRRHGGGFEVRARIPLVNEGQATATP